MALPANHGFQPRLTSEEELQELAKARSRGNDYSIAEKKKEL